MSPTQEALQEKEEEERLPEQPKDNAPPERPEGERLARGQPEVQLAAQESVPLQLALPPPHPQESQQQPQQQVGHPKPLPEEWQSVITLDELLAEEEEKQRRLMATPLQQAQLKGGQSALAQSGDIEMVELLPQDTVVAEAPVGERPSTSSGLPRSPSWPSMEQEVDAAAGLERPWPHDREGEADESSKGASSSMAASRGTPPSPLWDPLALRPPLWRRA